MKKKFLFVILIFITVLGTAYRISFASELIQGTLVTVPSQKDGPNINDLDIFSDCVLMMERGTGDVLYDRNGNEKMYPASTTKILTAIIVLEKCSLNKTAEVTSLALKAVPSTYTTCNIQIGEKFTVKDLLYTMLVRSANDAANVLAIHVSGSITGFAELMNQKAKEIGCASSHFTNPSGVHEEEHYSTARDLALLANYAMKNATFRDAVLTSSYSLPATEIYPHEDRTFKTSNSLIDREDDKYYYRYATGIKTGYTNASKDCIVASSKKDGVEFIVVILGSGQTKNGLRQKYLDCKTLFDFAFDNYTTYYKNLQVKRKSDLNPFSELNNVSSGQNEGENKIEQAETNVNNQEELQVAVEPIEVEEERIPNLEIAHSSFSPWITILLIMVLVIIGMSYIIFIFFNKKINKHHRNRRRNLR